MVLLLRRLALLLVLPQTSLGFVTVAPFASRVSCLFGSKEEDLFAQYCDPDGFMTKESLAKVPEIAEMLTDGDLTESELYDFWNKAPKFPDVEENKIDVDSFVQIYRDIDDLFIELVDDESTTLASSSSSSSTSLSPDEDDTPDDDEIELEDVFQQICNDVTQLLSKDQLREWDELARLLEDGLLGEDEFESLWSKTIKSPGTTDMLNVEGFLSFNVFLDDLFVFDDDEDDDDDDDYGDDDNDELAVAAPTKSRPQMVEGDDLPPGVLFAALANEDYVVGSAELQRWKELQGYLRDGDLLPEELQGLFVANAIKSTSGGMYLTEDSFVTFYDALDALFEDEEDEVSEEALEAKIALLEFLEELNDDGERLKCGLEADEREEEIVQNIVTALERNDAVNVIKKTNGDIQPADLIGDWRLLYSSSAAMKFNKGLSGIGGSFPNGKFGGLTQTLEFAKFRQDVVYKEQIDVVPSAASFEVEVNGAWQLRKSISLFTNRPCTMLSVEPNVVKYGPTSTRGDHWKSLGPMNLLDVTYLDDDLRIMRGNTASDAIFVWQRIK